MLLTLYRMKTRNCHRFESALVQTESSIGSVFLSKRWTCLIRLYLNLVIYCLQYFYMHLKRRSQPMNHFCTFEDLDCYMYVLGGERFAFVEERYWNSSFWSASAAERNHWNSVRWRPIKSALTGCIDFACVFLCCIAQRNDLYVQIAICPAQCVW